jgi:DNA polymerase-3 subunit delta
LTPVEKAAKNSLIMLAGEEDVLRRRAFDDLMRISGVEADDLDLQVFDAGSSSPVEWLASAGTSPFLADRRTVVVRHLLNCDPKGVELKGLPPSSLLVLVADEEGGSDDRLQRLKTVRKNWDKAVQAAGGAVLNFDPEPKAALAALRAEVAKLGKPMSERAATLMLEMVGGSLSRALEELDKVLLFVPEEQAITEREIRLVVVPSREWSVFKLTDAVVSNRVSEALTQLRILLGSTSKAEDAAFRQILPMMSRSLRLLWQGRLCIEAGVSPSTAPPEVTCLFPERPNLAKEQPYRQGPVMQLAKKTTLPRVAAALQVLSDTDARLKGALPGFSGVDTLERMILEMAACLAA